MADYYAILKRAISGLAEPTGESRRSVYEKARTALVAQLKSFDPPLSASEITQQRLQLEDAIRKVESESAKGLLNQALSRAALPDRPTAATQPGTGPVRREPSEPTAPAPLAPTGQSVQMVTADRGQSAPTPGLQSRVGPDAESREPSAPLHPPVQRPTLRPDATTSAPTGSTTSMRLARPKFEPGGVADTERVTGPSPTLATPPDPTRNTTMSTPAARDRVPPTSPLSRTAIEQSAGHDQEDVTQPIANRVLKKAVTDIDRLGTVTQQTARRARDALAVTETPLDEDLSTGGLRTTAVTRKPLTSRDRVSSETAVRNVKASLPPTSRTGSRWPMIIGLVVAAAVVGLGATAIYMKRDVIASFIGAQKPILETGTRAPSEKPLEKSQDRVKSEDAAAKPGPGGVKVVTTQPISPTADATTATSTTSGKTDVTAPPAAAPSSLPTGDALAIAQKASLLEEAADPGTTPVQTSGKVIWQLLKTPATSPDKPDVVRLQGRVEIPGRGILMFITIEQNTDPGLQASHLIKLEFKLPADFDNKSVARVPGMIMKTAEQARGDPLAGATAKITSNLFWIALYSADSDKAKNLGLIKDRGWIDIPIVYETNKRAMLTLEKAGAGDRVFNDALAAWGG